MDSFNKVISFVLGLVVVLVFLAVITGKLNLKSKISPTSSPTPTPIQKKSEGFFGFLRPASPTPTQKPPLGINDKTDSGDGNFYKQYNQTPSSAAPKSIPATGFPTLFIPILISGLAGGSFLKKAGRSGN